MLKMLETSPKSYKKTYIEGIPLGVNRGMALGKEIATAVEEDEDTGDIVKDLIIAKFPKYELRDKQMYIDLVVGKEKVPLRIQPDSCKADLSAFYEYKTGAGPWTQKIVDANSQLTFYATGIYILTKKIPEIELVWAPTTKVTGPDGIERPELTGDIHRFKTVRHTADILNMMVRMRKAWKKIDQLMQEELT